MILISLKSNRPKSVLACESALTTWAVQVCMLNLLLRITSADQNAVRLRSGNMLLYDACAFLNSRSFLFRVLLDLNSPIPNVFIFKRRIDIQLHHHIFHRSHRIRTFRRAFWHLHCLYIPLNSNTHYEKSSFLYI